MKGYPKAGLLLRMFCLVLIAVACGAPGKAVAQTSGPCAKPSDVQMVQLLNRWRAAFASGSAEQLSALYANDATLVATKDGKAYKGREAILAYYKDFLAHRPNLSIRPSSLAADCGKAIVSGPVVYRVTGERKGTRMLLGGRYTAEFKQVGDTWQIVRHSLAADPRSVGESFDNGAQSPSPRQ